MTPAEPSFLRRLLTGGTLLVALGALGAVSVPHQASATSLVQADARAWVADGDLVTGYSAMTGFGDDGEDRAGSETLRGPLARYARIQGESLSEVDGESGASAWSRVDTAEVRLDVPALVALGMIDLPGVPFETPEPPAGAEDTAPAEERGTGEPPGATSTPPSESEPEGEEPLILGENETTNVLADDNAVEFTVADVYSSADARYDGRTRADLEYGELTAFGRTVPDFEDEYVAEEVLEVFDKNGRVVEEVPVSVRFLPDEASFDDEHEKGRGEGIRSSLTVSVQVGDPEDENGFVVDFAETRASGFGRDGVSGEEGVEEAGGREAASPHLLATTGGSIAALVTAAAVTVGGGTAATFLARKRTTALDDRIED
ncbi:hypothetical protein ACIQFP_01055 [Nocardiopsis alba]|uniref:hypothetical protein n=1 Tax=Nocardiopsis alba TaxID=53437 RepID=UPI003829FC1C